MKVAMDRLGLGMPELIVVLFISIVWVVPVIAAVWALLTLQRLRATQEAMLTKLDAIERAVQRP